MLICSGEKLRVEYCMRATERDSEQILKRIGGVECENQRPVGMCAAVGVHDNSTVLGSEATISQIRRRISGGRLGNSVKESGDFRGIGRAGMAQC